LLTDFQDADTEVMPEDELLLQLARQRIEALNETYGGAKNDTFFRELPTGTRESRFLMAYSHPY
jgi:hypothetical protein